MIEFTKEQLAAVVHDRATVIHDGGSFSLNVQDLAAFTLAQMEQSEADQRELVERGKDIHALTCALESERLRAENAEKRMKAWGCPDEDFICLNCGSETPCMTEADLKPGDPGVPCTFDLTYPQMIERLRHYEDRQRKAEADRDRLKVELEEAEEALLHVAHGDGYDAYRGPKQAKSPEGYNNGRGDWTPFPATMQAAVRRARERGGRG